MHNVGYSERYEKNTAVLVTDLPTKSRVYYVYKYKTNDKRRHLYQHYNFSNFGYRTKLSRLAFLANALSTRRLAWTLLAVSLQQEKRL